MHQRTVLGGGMEHVEAWRGPALVGFFHRFADPEIERRFLTSILPQNRWRLWVAIGLAAALAGAGVLSRQIGFFTDGTPYLLWPAFLQLVICGLAGVALSRTSSVAGTEAVALGFAVAYLAARCLATAVQPGLEVSSSGAAIGTIALLYLGLPIRPNVLLPLMAVGSGAVVACWSAYDPSPGSAAIAQLLQWAGVMNFVAATNVRMLRFSVRQQWAQAQTLQHMAVHDELTGTATRLAYDAALLKEWVRCQGIGAPVSLIMLDVDFFKLLNDSLGPAIGDGRLRELARLLESCLSRPGQMLARTGGEEFAILLPETNEAAAASLARRVMDSITEAAIPHPCSPLGPHLTVSLGVATARAGDGYAAWELTALADRLVYAAKREGRNRVRQETLEAAAAPAPGGRLDAAGRQVAVG
jgi:diguanylate cyclase (GGDEF)-like protein